MRDERRPKVHQREVVARFDLPANEQGAEAIVPAVRAFDDPAARFAMDATDERGLAFLPNVWNDAALAHGLIAIPKRVAFVEAAVLRPAHPATRFQNHGIEGSSQGPFVVQVGAA